MIGESDSRKKDVLGAKKISFWGRNQYGRINSHNFDMITRSLEQRSVARCSLFEGVSAEAKTMLTSNGFAVSNSAASFCAPIKIDKLAVETLNIVGVRSRSNIDSELIAQLPALCAIGCFSVGTDMVDLSTARQLGIPVFNAPEASIKSVAELTIMQIIALDRKSVV